MDVDKTKGIIDGFKEDFEQTVKEFLNVSPQLQLGQFFKYWKEKSMDCLFANRFDPRELLEAIAKMNQVLVRILVNPSSYGDNHRIIALYFILCLYIKQPERLRRKIRLTCDNLICIHKLISQDGIVEDTNFVWRQLRTLDTIDLVEECVIYGPSMLVDKRIKKRSQTDSDSSEGQSGSTYELGFVTSKLEPALNEIETLCGPYELIRESLRLDEYNDNTAEIQSSGTVREFIDRAKLLLFLFKTENC